ncbi:MAG: chemotaxis protein CheX [Granulosicoccus sp.]|nr:chemotaxis protein CheX [Granulosicoccus sp.]
MSTIAEDELMEIVEVVWMTVLQLPIRAADDSSHLDGEILTADIEISGAWHGVVSLKASKELLAAAASVMFSKDVGEVNTVDCTDTLTELTNMLGGTVKCLLPETCDLSLPHIESGASEQDISHDWTHFECESHRFAVAVTERAADTRNVA